MKKLVMITMFLVFSFSLYAEEQNTIFMDYYRKATELGWLGLSYCIEIDDENEIEKELFRLSLDPTNSKVKIMDAKAAFEELKQYIESEKEFYNIHKGNPKFINFKGCIRMFYYGTGYGSDYNTQVERIVKKYCKDCK
ncbi:hypothetical protein [Helicobacter sp. MIT 14-3879]|uniref:hypothetical protein n=1 Tax=Helicobacter sp. MIT 14-3879 TaxID=2040649 RepID=UPI000E1E4423|nr:hypothetical protein [Helicobacter sp. MIT 14-3879]RDU58228.1 hypothetical protein CQA44_12300 [Helicobacter sp. MIT 14-3879]